MPTSDFAVRPLSGRLGRWLAHWLRNRLIDFAPLTTSERILVAVGYVSIILLLGFTLASQYFSGHLAVVEYGSPDAFLVPIVVVALIGWSYALGWAFLVAGATVCRRRVSLPLLFAFAWQLFFLMYGVRSSPDLLCLEALLACVLLGAVVIGHLLFRDWMGWHKCAWGQVVVWAGWLLLFQALALGSFSDLAAALEANLSCLLLAMMAFWYISAFQAIDIAVKLAHGVSVGLGRLFSRGVLTAVQTALILFHPVAAMLAHFVGDVFDLMPLYLFAYMELFPAAFMVMIMALLIVIRRWNPRTATIMLTLSLASPVFSLAAIGFDLGDPLGSLKKDLGLSSSGWLFVGFVVYDVFEAAVNFTRVDGRIIPRLGRILLIFGSTILVTSLGLFSINNIAVATGQHPWSELFGQPLLEEAFLFLPTIFYLGPFYLAWLIWRRRERLAGREEAWVAAPMPLFARLEGARHWKAALTVATFLILLTLCSSTCLMALIATRVFG